MKQFSAESILLPLQKLQQAHDELAHRDILSFDLYKRLKHMVLHFYKYAGKVEAAREQQDLASLRRTLIDTFIICMASANAMNTSLGRQFSVRAEAATLDALAHELAKDAGSTEDMFSIAGRSLVVLGGRMAKAIESSDHMEEGNPRAEMQELVPALAKVVLSVLGRLSGDLEASVIERLRGVEEKSIFADCKPAGR
jgi:hypothetical protein